MFTESDINFHTLTNEINDGIFVCDPDGKFIYTNLALPLIFGFQYPTELIGRNFEEFFSAEKRKEFMNQFQQAMESKTNTTIITSEIIRKDSTIGHIEVRPMPFIKDGVLLGNQGVVHDITNRKQAEYETMYTSTHDSLTGIYNRTFFEEEMKRLERGRQYPISIIMVNVGVSSDSSDPEKNAPGDKTIKRMAHLLFYAFRGDDIVARIGEDEFAILLPKVDEHALELTLNRIRGYLLEKTKDESESALEYFFGAGTGNEGERLNQVLKQAEAIAFLEKKKKKIA